MPSGYITVQRRFIWRKNKKLGLEQILEWEEPIENELIVDYRSRSRDNLKILFLISFYQQLLLFRVNRWHLWGSSFVGCFVYTSLSFLNCYIKANSSEWVFSLIVRKLFILLEIRHIWETGDTSQCHKRSKSHLRII